MRIAGIAVLVVAIVAMGGYAMTAFLNGRDSASVATGAAPGQTRAGQDLGPQADVGVPGNIVLLYADAADAAPLQALAEDVAGPPSAELQQAGQAVVVRRDAAAGGVVAVAAQRVLRATSPDDPQLRAFVERWLGDADAE